ncbi:MAG: hypothetical protein BWX84_00962 [Verrucomicrobia bacterium ADurb.Bin118]|nr:MAG: hypothetical protein BWX84_00962 [Verrucomicrobia bacterium ADurb.Bin118]
MVNRFTRWPFISKSSAAMLPDMSNATTMSTPLAVIRVSLRVSRGWARATMSSANASQRKAARKRPARYGVMLTSPRTSCAEE